MVNFLNLHAMTRSPSDRSQAQYLFEINWMIRRDMPEVIVIEDKCFEFPWIEMDFIRRLRQRNCIGMVASYDSRIIGYIVYELHKDHLHVLNMAVSPEFHRRQVGTGIINNLIGKLSHTRRTKITLDVRETNLAAQLFFRATGFMATSVIRDFYDETPEDAYQMEWRLVTSVSEPTSTGSRMS